MSEPIDTSPLDRLSYHFARRWIDSLLNHMPAHCDGDGYGVVTDLEDRERVARIEAMLTTPEGEAALAALEERRVAFNVATNGVEIIHEQYAMLSILLECGAVSLVSQEN